MCMPTVHFTRGSCCPGVLWVMAKAGFHGRVDVDRQTFLVRTEPWSLGFPFF